MAEWSKALIIRATQGSMPSDSKSFSAAQRGRDLTGKIIDYQQGDTKTKLRMNWFV